MLHDRAVTVLDVQGDLRVGGYLLGVFFPSTPLPGRNARMKWRIVEDARYDSGHVLLPRPCKLSRALFCDVVGQPRRILTRGSNIMFGKKTVLP